MRYGNLEHGGKTREKRDEHTRKAILACSTASHGAGRSRKTEKITRHYRVGWEKKGNLRTRVRFVNYGKTVLNDIAMLDGHNVVHAVSCEFFPVKIKKRSMPFLEKGDHPLCFSKPRLMEFVRP
jgi:hypothetical protein